jgi:hypothetical protein
VLGLVQEVGGDELRVLVLVGDDDALGRTEEHDARTAVALDPDLGGGNCGASWPDDATDFRDRLSAEGERCDSGRPVDAEHVAKAELVRDDEHRWINCAAAACRRHDDRDLRYTGNDRGGSDLHQHRREGAFPAWDEQSSGHDRRRLLADPDAWRQLFRPVGIAEDPFVVAANVVDPDADRLY